MPSPDYCSRFVSVDGIPTHYLEAGRGEPVLLLHGAGAEGWIC
jgi:pimeloyl-ACP methyl ester carboxylesterase